MPRCTFLDAPKITQERRAWDREFSRAKRSHRRLKFWDEEFRIVRGNRSWKRYRRTQYRPVDDKHREEKVTAVAQFDPAKFAADFSPKLGAALDARKGEIVAASGNVLIRQAVRLAWPTLEREIPELVEASTTALLNAFGKLTISEVMAALLQSVPPDSKLAKSCPTR